MKLVFSAMTLLLGHQEGHRACKNMLQQLQSSPWKHLPTCSSTN